MVFYDSANWDINLTYFVITGVKKELPSVGVASVIWCASVGLELGSSCARPRILGQETCFVSSSVIPTALNSAAV